MKNEKILITGSNGMLGKDIVRIFSERQSYNLYGINRLKDNYQNIHGYVCDIKNFGMLNSILEEINPSIIIHCAANINLDACEKEREYAYKINAKATEVLASYNAPRTKFVYISTDSVFDGLTGNYKEGDETYPLNYYAFTKLEGERLALIANPNSIIIRTNIYGLHTDKGNSLVEWGLKNLINGKDIIGFSDVFFNPVYTKQLAEACYELIKSEFVGLVNVASNEKLSKYDFLVKLANQFELNDNLIQKDTVDKMKFKAKRPKNTTLDTEKINKLINVDFGIDNGIKRLFIEHSNRMTNL